MSAWSWASGHLLIHSEVEWQKCRNKIAQLPTTPQREFCFIHQGLFNAPSEPNIAGFMISFCLSVNGLMDGLEDFLDFWESFIADIKGSELFINMEQELVFNDIEQPFGKTFLKWSIDGPNKQWEFQGDLPPDIATEWQSRFSVMLVNKLDD